MELGYRIDVARAQVEIGVVSASAAPVGDLAVRLVCSDAVAHLRGTSRTTPSESACEWWHLPRDDGPLRMIDDKDVVLRMVVPFADVRRVPIQSESGFVLAW